MMKKKTFPRLLTTKNGTYDTKKWAADGLSYLTLDADVKEELCNDKDSIKELFELVKVKNLKSYESIGFVLISNWILER